MMSLPHEVLLEISKWPFLQRSLMRLAPAFFFLIFIKPSSRGFSGLIYTLSLKNTVLLLTTVACDCEMISLIQTRKCCNF